MNAQKNDRRQRSGKGFALGGRISTVADALGTRINASKIAGISTDMLQRYISGRSQPSFIPIARMAEAAGVRLDWVWSGRGPMVLPGVDTGYIQEAPAAYAKGVEACHHSLDEALLRNMIRKLEKLIEETDEKWTPDEKADLIIRAYKEELEEEALPDKQRRIIKLIRSV